MAVYDLEEQEQLDELKTWWKRYGNLVTGILLAAAVAAVGWQGWNWYQRNQTAQASAVFVALQQAADKGDARRTRELAGELIDKFSGTTYAAMGVLISAKLQVDGGDAKGARPQLVWAAEKAADPALRDLARLRLAVVLLDDKALDEAAALLAREPSPAFLPRYYELKGDVLVAQGKAADGKAAYDSGIKQLELRQKAAGVEGDPGLYAELLRAKRDRAGSVK